jgi:hypothetical protein
MMSLLLSVSAFTSTLSTFLQGMWRAKRFKRDAGTKILLQGDAFSIA